MVLTGIVTSFAVYFFYKVWLFRQDRTRLLYENDEEEVRQDAENKINFLYMNKLKSLLCSLVISERDFVLLCFIAATIFFLRISI
jgi:hypothetical protein